VLDECFKVFVHNHSFLSIMSGFQAFCRMTIKFLQCGKISP
jgi:hypothetical protein